MPSSNQPSAFGHNKPYDLQQIQAGLRQIPLPEDIAVGFSEHYFNAYDTGISAFDHDVKETLIAEAGHTLENLQEATTHLYTTTASWPSTSIPTEMGLPTLKNLTIPDLSDSKIAFYHPGSLKFTEIADRLGANAQLGIEQTPLQMCIHGLERIMYHAQAPEGAHTSRFTMGASYIRELGLQATNGELDTADLHGLLHQKGAIDLSRRTLDRRFQLFSRTAQANAIEIMGMGLSLISHTGVKQRNLAGLEFQALLILGKSNDLVSRINLLDRIGERWQEAIEHTPDAPTAEAVGYFSVQALTLSRSMKHRVLFFDEVYDGLNFRPPLPGMGQTHHTSKVRRAAEAEQEKLRIAEERAQQLAELDALLPKTISQIEIFNASWSLTSKAFKSGDFQDLRRALIGEDETYRLPQRAAFTKPDARCFIDVLAVLQRHFDTKDTAAVHDIIQVARITEKALVKQIQFFSTQFKQLRPGALNIEEPRPIQAFTDLVQSHWDSYERVLASLWPHNGQRFAAQLKELFMPSEPEDHAAEIAVPDSIETTSPASTKAETVQEQPTPLDAIVLPAKPRDEQVRTELVRLGIKPRDLTPQKIARFNDFRKLAHVFDCELFISRAGAATSQRRYYIMRINYDGKKYVAAESVGLDRATYVIAEHLVPGTAEEMLDLYKDKARELGAKRIEHIADGTPHHEKILNLLLELHEQPGNTQH